MASRKEKSSPADIAADALQSDAWIGDAVLELYARMWILREHGAVDAAMKTRFTCNQFLNCIGQPTRVEARIGALHREHGLEAAFAWIQEHLEPLFLTQEGKRRRGH